MTELKSTGDEGDAVSPPVLAAKITDGMEPTGVMVASPGILVDLSNPLLRHTTDLAASQRQIEDILPAEKRQQAFQLVRGDQPLFGKPVEIPTETHTEKPSEILAEKPAHVGKPSETALLLSSVRNLSANARIKLGEGDPKASVDLLRLAIARVDTQIKPDELKERIATGQAQLDRGYQEVESNGAQVLSVEERAKKFGSIAESIEVSMERLLLRLELAKALKVSGDWQGAKTALSQIGDLLDKLPMGAIKRQVDLQDKERSLAESGKISELDQASKIKLDEFLGLVAGSTLPNGARPRLADELGPGYFVWHYNAHKLLAAYHLGAETGSVEELGAVFSPEKSLKFMVAAKALYGEGLASADPDFNAIMDGAVKVLSDQLDKSKATTAAGTSRFAGSVGAVFTFLAGGLALARRPGLGVKQATAEGLEIAGGFFGRLSLGETTKLLGGSVLAGTVINKASSELSGHPNTWADSGKQTIGDLSLYLLTVGVARNLRDSKLPFMTDLRAGYLGGVVGVSVSNFVLADLNQCGQRNAIKCMADKTLNLDSPTLTGRVMGNPLVSGMFYGFGARYLPGGVSGEPAYRVLERSTAGGVANWQMGFQLPSAFQGGVGGYQEWRTRRYLTPNVPKSPW